jgi:type IV pilus assembly protein PilN
MIKVNLLTVKRKKKAKPLPAFLLSTIAVTIGVCLVMAYLVFFFSSRLNQKKVQFAANEKKIAELKEKIKAVDDFEKRNKTFRERSDIIEQLSRNKSVPVRILDEVSSILPTGTWINAMTVSGDTVSIDGYGFTNTEIVNFVDNVKNSRIFNEVYLLESKSTQVEKVPVYVFKMTFKVKA